MLVGFAAAYIHYAKAAKDPLPEKLGALARVMRNRFCFDEIYQATVIRLHDFLAAVADWFDRWIIAGLAVWGTHGTTELLGRALRLLQTGNLQTYAFLFALGLRLSDFPFPSSLASRASASKLFPRGARRRLDSWHSTPMTPPPRFPADGQPGSTQCGSPGYSEKRR